MGVRARLANLLHFVDVSIGDHVWLQFRNMLKIALGFCYIPPTDSPYFSNVSFATFQKMCVNRVNECIIVGDMNIRFAKTVRDVLAHIKVTNDK